MQEEEARAKAGGTYSGAGGDPGRRTTAGNPGAPSPAVFKWAALVFLEAIAALIILTLGITMFTGSRTPSLVAERFFVALVNGDYESAFSSLNLEEDLFINPRELAVAYSDKDFSEVANYIVSERNIGYDYYLSQNQQSDLGGDYTVRYRDEGAAEDRQMDISIVKSGKDRKWYISSGNLIIKSVRVRVLKGAGLMIDGIEVPEEYASVETEQYNGGEMKVYTIPRMFKGKHFFCVTADGRQTVTSVNSLYGDEESLNMQNMLYSQETLLLLQEKAAANMKRIYEAVLQEDTFESIIDLFTADADRLENIRSEYENLINNMRGDRYRIKSLTTGEIQAHSDIYNPSVSVSFECDAVYDETSYWSDEVTEKTGSRSCSSTFVFTEEDGEWVQTTLGCRSLSF
ncbi:MAG: hypothetical protein Q4D81_12265 [Eubacteriales bacterium]|nr:hypothetical protein [Eubacteriales bacterium]